MFGLFFLRILQSYGYFINFRGTISEACYEYGSKGREMCSNSYLANCILFKADGCQLLRSI